MIESGWLRAFVAFAEERNFTRAAQRLHLSQPALHVQVRKLSEQVGVPLYERDGRGVRLTPEGEALLAFGRESEARAAAFLAELRGTAPRPVVLAAGEGAYLYLLGQGIRDFVRNGLVSLELITGDREATVEAVRSGRAQLGVTAIEEAPRGISLQRLCRVGAIVVFPRSHRFEQMTAVRVADLHGERLVVPPRGRPHRTALAGALAEAEVAWEPAIEANRWELILHFASLGLGLAVVNEGCRIPRGMAARPLVNLPKVSYRLLRRAGAFEEAAVDQLERCLRRGLPPALKVK
ncbi:MAG: LysR family transcriptional regulator [Myxococcota bacterium]